MLICLVMPHVCFFAMTLVRDPRPCTDDVCHVSPCFFMYYHVFIDNMNGKKPLIILYGEQDHFLSFPHVVHCFSSEGALQDLDP